jgi:cytochrome P450
LPTETDPPYTQKLRAVLMPFLTAKRVEAMQPRMEALCRELIGGFRPNGRCDAVAQFARVYPVTIFMELFGLPADRREEFRQLANIFLHHADHRAETWVLIRSIIEAHIQAKRENPANDLLSVIATGEIDGAPLDIEVAVNLAATLFVGGLDTLPSNISWSLLFLAENPDFRRQIVEKPAIIPSAVEEFLRLYSVANPMRRVTRDVVFRGANMLAGDRLLCSIASACRDKDLFGNQIAFDRKNNPHLAFASGPHRCLGSHLARHELAVALKVWHEMIPDYRVVPGTQLKYQGPVFAIDSLPLAWDR